MKKTAGPEKKRQKKEHKEKKSALAAPKKEAEEAQRKTKADKLRDFFRRAIFISLVAHSPIIGPAFGKHEPFQYRPLQIDMGGKGWISQWGDDVKKDLEKEMGEKEAEEVMEKTDEESLKGFELAKKAI